MLSRECVMFSVRSTYEVRPPPHGGTTAPQRPSAPVTPAPQHTQTPQLSAKEIRRGQRAARSQGRADRADSPGWKRTRLTSYEPPSFDSTYRITHNPSHGAFPPFQIYTSHNRTEMVPSLCPPQVPASSPPQRRTRRPEQPTGIRSNYRGKLPVNPVILSLG